MAMEKNNRWNFAGIAIIWDGKGLYPAFPTIRKRNATTALPAGGWGGRKEGLINLMWKRFFFLDFEREFLGSFLKLLLFWNPLWTFLVSLVLEGFNPSSVLFRWGWSFFEASVVGLFGMSVVGSFLLVERLFTARGAPRHGTGWYLLFLAFLVPPGLYLALRLMMAYINWTYLGAPIPTQFHWQYYGKEIFWGWMLLLVFFLFKSWEDLRDTARLSRLRAEELEKERLQALLSKLKDQMNPHFLFNTLNTVAALIPADPLKAEKVVVKLSALFQGVLAATRRTRQPLEKEMEFCRDYLEIEQARFGPRLNVIIGVEPGLDAGKVWVPVLLLQPLVENAVKHGLSPRAAGGNLWVGAGLREGRLQVWVEDDGVGFGNSPYAGSGTALDNCRKRLELEFGKDGRLEITPRAGGGTRVAATLPVLDGEPAPGEEK